MPDDAPDLVLTDPAAEAAAERAAPPDGSASDLLHLPALPLLEVVVLPDMVSPIHLDRWSHVRAVEVALLADKQILLLPMKGGEDTIGPEEVGRVGLIATVEESRPSRRGGQRVIVRGGERAIVTAVVQTEPFPQVACERLPDPPVDLATARPEMDELLAVVENLIELTPTMPTQVLEYVRGIQEPGLLADYAGYSPECSFDERLTILDTVDPMERVRMAYTIMRRHLDLAQLRAKIRDDVKAGVDKSQREYFLREQLRVIQRELGENEGEAAIADELREKIEAANMPELARERALKELSRLRVVGPHSPEQGIIRTYLEWLIELPWAVMTEDHVDVTSAAQVLEEDHYGLEKVKERILEYIAVRQLAGAKMRSPILCFAGPPGVGKTSLGRSIARALGRGFWRTSLGGVRDEAEIRGHRRTYVGALPGRIIQGMRNVKTSNPVFMLDEIDKVGNDFRGDPSAALLEVLDPEQNYAFSDHYLEVPFDLSNVIFILTANMLDTAPPALRDRMEVISIAGYTEDEKLQIAQRFLVPKQREAHGLSAEQIHLGEDTLHALISGYTREAGVRNLEREIATLCRKVARKIVAKEAESVAITPGDLAEYLGPHKFTHTLAEEHDEVGVATGVAWTETGGELLSIEVSVMEGKGEPVLTGHLGKVMQESARAALTYARANARRFDVDPAFFDNHMIHVHVPAGGVPKDGPSAGIALTTALISALTGRPVRKDVAMTGEVTLRGRVLPIGGLKEKMLAAHRAGISTFLLPKKNAKDLVGVPERVREMELVEVEGMDEVLAHALVGQAPKKVGAAPRPKRRDRAPAAR